MTTLHLVFIAFAGGLILGAFVTLCITYVALVLHENHTNRKLRKLEKEIEQEATYYCFK